MIQADDFTLPDQEGILHSLSQYHGKWVVLFFYPKDDTPGCTKEACNFRDSFAALQSFGAIILGVSKDSVASHKKFAQKYHLNYPVLSDEKRQVIQTYNAWGKKTFMGRVFEGTLRITYLINPGGAIQKVYDKVNPTIHAGEILGDLKKLTKAS